MIWKSVIVSVFLTWPASGAWAQESSEENGCVKCHVDLDDDLAALWKDDVHAKAGIGCELCHGGNPNADDADRAMAKKAGFRGVPKRSEIPHFCGRCHSDAVFMKQYAPMLPVDQLEKYWTSVHGKKIRGGDVKVAECVSCHGSHGIRKVTDPRSPVYPSNLPKMCAHCHADEKYMASYKIPTNQYSDYLESVHGKAVLVRGDVRGAPACNDCHGNHGATPPGLHTITNVCGSCHQHNAELFLVSPMAKPLERDPLGECIACHGKHKIIHVSDDWVGNQSGALCMRCHKAGEKGAEFAGYIARSIGSAKKELARVSSVVEEARLKGMDVTEGMDALQAARQALIQLRTELHAFAKAPVEVKLDDGRQNLRRAENLGLAALRENMTRRLGLAVSTILLTLVVIGLALKIRSLSPPG